MWVTVDYPRNLRHTPSDRKKYSTAKHVRYSKSLPVEFLTTDYQPGLRKHNSITGANSKSIIQRESRRFSRHRSHLNNTIAVRQALRAVKPQVKTTFRFNRTNSPSNTWIRGGEKFRETMRRRNSQREKKN